MEAAVAVEEDLEVDAEDHPEVVSVIEVAVVEASAEAEEEVVIEVAEGAVAADVVEEEEALVLPEVLLKLWSPLTRDLREFMLLRAKRMLSLPRT